MNGINFKKHLKIVIICVFALTVLAISFFCGAPSSDNVQKNPDMPQSTVLDKSKENPEKTKEEIVTIDKDHCPRCGGLLVKRHGPYGNFYGCENFPINNCRYTRKFK